MLVLNSLFSESKILTRLNCFKGLYFNQDYFHQHNELCACDNLNLAVWLCSKDSLTFHVLMWSAMFQNGFKD